MAKKTNTRGTVCPLFNAAEYGPGPRAMVAGDIIPWALRAYRWAGMDMEERPRFRTVAESAARWLAE